MIWLTTDWHLGHERALVERFNERPADYADQIRSGLDVVRPEDVLINLGDVLFGRKALLESFLENCYGCYVLVRGNHDKETENWYRKCGFDFVCDRFELYYKGVRFVFTHCPVQVLGDELNVFGHWHGNDHRIAGFESMYLNSQTHFHLALERTKYKPVPLDKIVGLYQKRKHIADNLLSAQNAAS